MANMAFNQYHSTNVSNPGDLVTNIVDHYAKTNPDALYAEYPISEWSYEEGYRKITRRDLANAVNGAAWWLHDSLGPGTNFEALAYIGPNDVRYVALIIGAVKAGYMMFLTSPRNSVAAQVNLFDRLKCKTILSPTPRPPSVNAVLASFQLRVVEVPSVDDLLGENHPPFPFTKSFIEARSEPVFAIHTSGSTGMPKPLIYTHDTLARNTKMMSLEPPPGSDSLDRMYQGKRVFMAFPPFHGAYLVSHLSGAVPYGTVLIAPTSGPIPSAEGLVQGLKQTPTQIAFLVPSIVQELSQSAELLDYCSKKLEAIILCGGDLTPSIGDYVSSKVRLFNQWGSAEVGMAAHLLSHNRSRQDWKYVEFHPDMGLELRHVTDDVYESYVVRDPKKEEQQPAFTIFPNIQEYSSHDLFVPHPSKDKPNLWNWHARADDIIVFLNGEKTNPVTTEQRVIACSPTVAAALVVGAQRFQAALLIEPVTNGKELLPAERAAFIEEIWPIIEECNKENPGQARIAKSHILFTHPQRPMLRAGKGTLQRAGTLSLYVNEIDALYSDAETMAAEVDEESPGILSSLDEYSVSKFTRKAISLVTGRPGIDDADNLFTLGMDSLQALTIIRKLKQGLGMSNIALSTLYTNPTVTALTAALLRLSRQQQDSLFSDEQDRSRLRSSTFKEYCALIDQIPISFEDPQKVNRQTVILTGSTGALGSYILHTLLAKPVHHVYCLNRAIDAEQLQIGRNRARGLPTQLDASRVTFLTADLSKLHLGLSFEIYRRLLNTVTHIIHNAWPVNFNLSLSSFQPQLHGLINLVKLSSTAATSPHLFFVSSISSVMSYHTPSLQTPEEVIAADSAPGPSGYAESKYLSERLLDYAAKKLSINTSFSRVGQIAGAVSNVGLWNKAEWFPSLILSSWHIGALPDSLGSKLGRIDWVPIDLLVEVLVDLVFSRDHSTVQNGSIEPKTQHKGASVFHPLNPHPTSWEAIKPILISALSTPATKQETSSPMDTIPIGSWLARVRQDMEATASSDNAITDEDLAAFLEINPAVKLLSFYEEAMGAQKDASNVLEVEATLRKSEKLRALESVRPEWIRKWVEEWLASMK